MTVLSFGVAWTAMWTAMQAIKRVVNFSPAAANHSAQQRGRRCGRLEVHSQHPQSDDLAGQDWQTNAGNQIRTELRRATSGAR